MPLVLGGEEKSHHVLQRSHQRGPVSQSSPPTYPLSRGADGPSTTRLSPSASFAFFTSGARGSLGPSGSLRTSTEVV